MESTYIPIPHITATEVMADRTDEIMHRIAIAPYGAVYEKIKMLEKEFNDLTFEQAVEIVRLRETVQLNESVKEIKSILREYFKG